MPAQARATQPLATPASAWGRGARKSNAPFWGAPKQAGEGEKPGANARTTPSVGRGEEPRKGGTTPRTQTNGQRQRDVDQDHSQSPNTATSTDAALRCSPPRILKRGETLHGTRANASEGNAQRKETATFATATAKGKERVQRDPDPSTTRQHTSPTNSPEPRRPRKSTKHPRNRGTQRDPQTPTSTQDQASSSSSIPKTPRNTQDTQNTKEYPEYPFLQGKTHHRQQGTKNTRALDLFSGTGSVGKHLMKQGFGVISLDISRTGTPTICEDILTWDYRQYPPNFFRLIAAGVPCTEYSTAKTIGTRALEHADQVVLRTMEIIEYFHPEIWWIENPRGGMLKHRPFMKNIPFLDVDYCQFSDWGYQKPTRLWCCERIANLPQRVCDPQICPNNVQAFSGGRRHRERLGGYQMKFSTRAKFRTPSTLVDYLLSAFELPKAGGENGQPS